MHTVEFHDIASDEHGPERTGDVTRFHYHGDYSGNVVVVREVNGGVVEMEVPFEHIKALVARHILKRKISQLEQADPDEILEI